MYFRDNQNLFFVPDANELWHINSLESSIKTEMVKPQTDSQVLIESHYSLISKGTEKLVACGQVPRSLHDKMTVPYMKGSFDFPLSYGYSLVGKVVSAGEYNGNWVQLLHPHKSHVVAKKNDLYNFTGIPPKRAVLLSNMETVINAIWDADIRNGDQVLICGFGSIGALLAMTLKIHFKVDLWVHDPDKEKQRKMKQLGFSSFDPTEDKINSLQLAFNCSASAKGLQLAIDSVGFEGKVIETSWYGDRAVKINLGGSFHYNRKKIISSQVSNISSKMQSQFDFHKRKVYAEELLQHPDFDLLLDYELSLDNAPIYFDHLRKNEQGSEICAVINYNP